MSATKVSARSLALSGVIAALYAALADTGITPEPDAESAASDGAMCDGFALVYVADEWPEDAD